MSSSLPHQSHSQTSIAGAGHVPPHRVNAQEQWVYEMLRLEPLADWQLWRLAERRKDLFEQLSSMRRARIGLVWTRRINGATPYHPVENSGTSNINPDSNVECAVWQIKPFYLGLSYADWAKNYRRLARGK